MALVRWQGTTFSADPVRKLPNGNWIMRSRQHHARFTVGSEIEVQQGEIVEMAAAEMLVPMAEHYDDVVLREDPASLAALESAMAEERKTLTPVAELLAKAPKTVEAGPGNT